ncbi:hypothetical protein [Methanoplanus limicola]|nr:hypothetical protein [Methanoplanus limicola]
MKLIIPEFKIFGLVLLYSDNPIVSGKKIHVNYSAHTPTGEKMPHS